MDKYDREIEKIMAAPFIAFEVVKRWRSASPNGEGCLFQFMTPSGSRNALTGGAPLFGCLTQIRNSATFSAYTPELTDLIRADERIPKNPTEVCTREQLEVFAEYQRLADATIRQPQGAEA